MSASKAKYIVLVAAAVDEGAHEFDTHICGAFVEFSAALQCVKDDHADTGVPLVQYYIEAWRGRQDLGRYNHEGKLVEVTRGGE